VEKFLGLFLFFFLLRDIKMKKIVAELCMWSSYNAHFPRNRNIKCLGARRWLNPNSSKMLGTPNQPIKMQTIPKIVYKKYVVCKCTVYEWEKFVVRTLKGHLEFVLNNFSMKLLQTMIAKHKCNRQIFVFYRNNLRTIVLF
jgi:hypothetical protein